MAQERLSARRLRRTRREGYPKTDHRWIRRGGGRFDRRSAVGGCRRAPRDRGALAHRRRARRVSPGDSRFSLWTLAFLGVRAEGRLLQGASRARDDVHRPRVTRPAVATRGESHFVSASFGAHVERSEGVRRFVRGGSRDFSAGGGVVPGGLEGVDGFGDKRRQGPRGGVGV